MTEKPIGFVKLQAADVIELATSSLTLIKESREDRRKEFVANVAKGTTGLFGRRQLTEDEAIKKIKGDFFMSHEYYFVSPEFVSDNQRTLRKLRDVAKSMLEGRETLMEISIEAADLLFM